MYVLPSIALLKTVRMLHIKFIIGVADLLGITGILAGIVSDINDVKIAIAFIMGTVYGAGRVYFYFKKQFRIERQEEIDIKMKELEYKERLAKIK